VGKGCIVAEKKIYIGSVGPFLYDDTDNIDDPDGDFSGQTLKGLTTDGVVAAGSMILDSIDLYDTNNSNVLALTWNEDDTGDRTLQMTVNAGNRVLALHGNLTVEAASLVNQDLTDDASPTFEALTMYGLNVLVNAGEVITNDGEVVFV